MDRSARPTVCGGAIGVKFSACPSLLGRTWWHTMRELRLEALRKLSYARRTTNCTIRLQSRKLPSSLPSIAARRELRVEGFEFRVSGLGFGVGDSGIRN